MGFGSIISGLGGAIFGGGSTGASVSNVLGSGLDAFLSFRSQQDAQKLLNQQIAQGGQVSAQALALAQRQAKFDEDLRKQLLNRSAQIDDALKKALKQLGPRAAITQSQIATDQDLLERQFLEDLNRTLDRVNSQGFAENIRRGVSESTAEQERRRDLTNRFFPAVLQARNTAAEEAIRRAAARETAVAGSRQNILGELSGVLNEPFNRGVQVLAGIPNPAGALSVGGTASAGLADLASTQADANAAALGSALDSLASDIRNF